MNIQIVGVPSHAGALYEGTEMAPDAIREAGLVQRFTDLGFTVTDRGNLLTKQNLPRHNVGPVRNWPAPRMVWDEIEQCAEQIFQKDSFTVILGGDCSIEVGTFHAFRKVFGSDSHLLVLDGHVDTMRPQGEICVGAAGMGLGFLLYDQSIWWNKEPINKKDISILGPVQPLSSEDDLNIITHQELTTHNIQSTIQEHLHSITSNSIFVHLDVDVLHKSIMPAAYSPSEIGLDLTTTTEILSTILTDPRVKGIEITEFSANKDQDKNSANLIIDLLSLLKFRFR